MNEDIKDKAYTLAKRRGDTVVTVYHVLYVVAFKHAEHLRTQGIDINCITQQLGEEGGSIKVPSSFSDDAVQALHQIPDNSSMIKWAIEAYQKLISEPSNHEKPVHAQSSVVQTTQTSVVCRDMPDTPQSRRSVDEIFQDLDNLTGLHKVKRVIRDVVATQKAALFMKDRGQEVTFSKHLVFTGSPGTGKTTVARYIGELYAAINVLPGDTFVEVGRADLIGEYVGQTAPKVRAVVERARGGVLFIDEAYALMPTSANDYGHEALSTLVQLMENHRHDLVVVMAGYRHEMQAMIDTNPGLRSRMTTYIDFPNYTPAELSTIFTNIVHSYGLHVENDAVAYLQNELDTVVSHVGFGNARFVRSVWEHAFSHMATREFADGVFDSHELRVLRKDDVQYACDELLQGLRQYTQHRPKRMSITHPGIATGLAWTAMGGDILYLEAAAIPGEETLQITGQLGSVMSESVLTAISCVKQMSSDLAIEANFFDKYTLHIHAPEGAIPKDGPSAGVTLATAIASVATNRCIRDDVAMTGEITLYGRVLKVGGVREKIMAAHREGIRTVIIPYDNLADINDVPQSVRTEMNIIGVQSVTEVLAHALGQAYVT